MKNSKIFLMVPLIALSSLVISGCGRKSDVGFSNDEEIIEEVTPYVDKLANEKINIINTYTQNQEFKVKYKTYNPDGEGLAEFKAKSIKEISSAGKKTPDEGKKLILVEIAVKGNGKNKGSPSNFNQIGETPSPQFVIIDKNKNITETEITYFSDGYTETKKMFELTEITLDHEQWVNTAIVFQLDKNQEPDLAFRFTNIEGKTEFYDIQ